MPIYPGFCSGSNATQSVFADCERTMNLYPETVDAAHSPTGKALFPTPGGTDFSQTTDVDCRALFSTAGRTFSVVGGHLWEHDALGVATRRGAVVEDVNPATISYNRSSAELFITSGNNGYAYDLTTNTLALVLTNQATMGGMKDGRFLAFNTLDGLVRISDLDDGLTWDPLNFFGNSATSDPWKAMVVANPYIWMIGEYTGWAWASTGTYPDPFAPAPGAFFEYGTAAPFSVGVAGGTVVWLAQTREGAGQIVGASGYTPRPISTYAVETALAAYRRAGSITDCEVLIYRQEGHLFSVFNFAKAGKSWAVDMTTGEWHERSSLNAAGLDDVWQARVCAEAFGRTLVGSRYTGMISTLDNTYGTDLNGASIRRLRIGAPLWASSRERLIVSRFGLIMDVGLGVVAGPGVDPQVMFQSSTNGRTWDSERMCSAGPMGQYGRHVAWTRCGSSTGLWIPQVTMTDPIPWRIAAAEIDGSGFGQLTRAA